MSIELPKDAEGREIPLDAEVLYDRCGTKVSVKEFLSRTSVENQRTGWTIKAVYDGNIDYNSFRPKDMHLTQPDTWERLLEDLGRCISGDSACRYFASSENCEDCRIDKNNEQGGCVELVFKDIVRRIRKLRGEDDG